MTLLKLETERGTNQYLNWSFRANLDGQDLNTQPNLRSLCLLRNQYIVWRHGESQANVEGKIISKPENGINNYGLTEAGVIQVRRTIMIAKTELGIDEEALVYTSPFLRCVQTAQEIARIAGVAGVAGLIQVNALRERDFGDFEGRAKVCYQTVYDLDIAQPGHKLYGVESTQEVLQRVTGLVRALEFIHRNKTIVLVTHADVGEILQTAFLDLPAYLHRRLPKLKNSEPRVLSFENLEPAYA